MPSRDLEENIVTRAHNLWDFGCRAIMIRYALKKEEDIIWEFFPTWGGGVFPNPKFFFVNLPSIFLYAKLILRC